MTHRYLPFMLVGGYKTGQTPQFPEGFQGPLHPCFSYEKGVTCRLTGQSTKWEPAIK